MTNQLKALAAAGVLLFAGTAQAALIDRGGGLIYDDVLNVTWLSDWNYAVTSGYAAANVGGAGANQVWVNGRMGWDAANTWADTLVFGGYNDWRLSTALNTDGSRTCLGFQCTGSEMGHMYYDNWGAPGGVDFSLGTNAANLALFINVQSSSYWSGTELEWDPSRRAWYFGMLDGLQYDGGKIEERYVVAVRPGDVTAPIPEPETYALMLAGLAVVGFVARRRRL